MGRLQSRRARWLLTAAVLAALPLAALLGGALRLADGVPIVTLVTAVLVAYLLSVGPRGWPVAVLGYVLECTLTLGMPLGVGVVVLGGVRAALVVAGVRLLEARFCHHGPVRRPIVMVEYGAIAGALVPVAVELSARALAPVVGTVPHAGSILDGAVASGLGVLTLTAGIRMVIKGQYRQLDRTRLPVAAGASAVSALAVLGVAAVGGESAVGSGQLLAIPVLALALLVGTVAYSMAATTTLLAVTVPLALSGAVGGWSVPVVALVGWWTTSFVGLLLATDGDRRRAVAAEFRTFFLRSATPSLTVNTRDGLVLRVNDAVGPLLGVDPAELVGRPLATLLPDHEGLHARLEVLRTGTVDEVTVEFALPTGREERWVRCVAVHVDLGGPQHDLLQVQLIDLTAERHRAATLERSNESLEQFGRRVTHDLKQPVAAVAAYASTLLEHGERMDESMVRTMHERLSAAARRAVQQLDDTFAAAAARDPGRVDVRLHELVADVVGVVDIDLAESGGTVATNLMRGHVHSEPAVLRQVLLNLLTNSLKYARAGVAPRIHVTSRVRGAGVEVIVTDNGIGLPPDALEAVFERGVRLVPERADGRGHGLADSRQLATSLGGTLRAEPWPDGARFVLWLPDPSAAGAQQATRVLVVAAAPEDAVAVRERLSHRSAVQVVATAATIGDAVLAARDVRPDVVLLHRALYETGGVAGVVEVARAHRDARIVLLADIDCVDDVAAHAAGAVRCVALRMDDDLLVDRLLGQPG